MAKRILNQLLFSNKIKFPITTRRFSHNTNQVQTKEIQIPVQWGHIAAKLWGNENERPILALHGWQDNAGTWDPLAPLISKHRSILAIDFPGHGCSSWVPPGIHYYAWDLPRIILYLKEYFKWEKISLLCHSMGAIAALRFSCLFPDDVDFFIAIDSLVADDYDLNIFIDKYPSVLRKINLQQTRLNEEPPSYTLEEIAKIWHLGTRKSVTMESAHILLKRGAKQSKKDPNKYYFSRDSRLKYTLFTPEKKIFVETLVKKLICPTLYIKAIDSPFSCDEFSVEMREIIAKNNEKYECHFVPGTHHVHLNTPELVFPLILNFLQKYNFHSI
ncbi:probable serine hydrolase [Galleria mellonella]|uniref:Probable serine hydrolase n=1 Tax=Galleria mellonella TaxID=7137 RepID=A0ABM3MHL6_GALME|nr:probable serine hydrolase [Galleria mellonella]